MRAQNSRILIPLLSLMLLFQLPVALAQGTVYSNPSYRWSVSVPDRWILDDANPSLVRIWSPQRDGLCGIHSGLFPFKTADEFADDILARTSDVSLRSGLIQVISARQPIVLANSVAGVDVLVDIVPGGRSRRIFVIIDGHGFAIDCEAAAENWSALELSFDGIIRSFNPNP